MTRRQECSSNLVTLTSSAYPCDTKELGITQHDATTGGTCEIENDS